MATENRGVMVYLPSEVEAKITEYCTEHNITRKDKQGNVVASLGSGIVAYLKSQLLSGLPKLLSDRPIVGLTREEVLDLIKESDTTNIPIDRSPDPIAADVLHRLEMVEQKLSSSTDIARHEVEKLIQESEQKIMDAVGNISIEQREERAEVKTIDDRINASQKVISNSRKDKAIEDTTDTKILDRKPMSKDIKRWLEPLKNKKFRDIIQAGISDESSNQEIVIKLFDAGYGKDNNTNPYPANLASAMKTAFSIEAENHTLI